MFWTHSHFLLPLEHLFDLVLIVKFPFNANVRRTHHIYQELRRRRSLYKREFDFRILIVHNLLLDDLQKPHLTSYSISQLAELRAWQQTAYALACIDTALSFIYSAIAFDALTMRICEAMFATILSLPAPCTHPPPAKPQPDDKDRVTDRRLFYDEPLMQSLISSFDDESRQLLKGAAERERARLPLFPSDFTAS